MLLTILKSIIAIVLGLLSSFILLYASALGLKWVPSPAHFGGTDMVITGARWFITSMVGGFVTAATVRRAPIRHGLIIGGLLAAVIAYGVAWGDLDFFSPWFIDS